MNGILFFEQFLGRYAAWHYTQAYRDMRAVWANLLGFVFRFFSTRTMFADFFRPWKRMDEGYPKGFDPAGFASTLIVNTLMRAVGMAVRTVLIFLAVFFALLVVLAEILAIFIWTFAPVFLAALVILGIYLLA